MSLKRIPLKKVDGLKKFCEEGGLGTIYIAPPSNLIKIYLPNDNEDAAKISKRLGSLDGDDNLYEKLASFCGIPEALVQREDNGQIVGFQMKHFKDFNPLGKLLSKPYCVTNKVRIRDVTNIFLALHDYLSIIHGEGFLVGDLSENNILFKLIEKTVHLAFVDVDSWAIHRPGLNIPAEGRTQTFCHPEIEKDPSKLQAHHDWYSYAVLLARSLVKNDPFNLGGLDDATMRSIRGTSQERGITCWDPRVRLTDEESLYTKRFGTKLTNTLQTWLQGNQKGVFPKNILEQFLDGLTMCRGNYKGNMCKLEIHIDHGKCTRCGEKLIPPTLRDSSRRKSSVVSQLASVGG